MRSAIKEKINQIWTSPKESKILRWLSIAFWILSIGGILFASLTFFFLSKGDLPSFDQLENPQYDLASIIYSNDGTSYGKYYIENREFVDFSDLSPNITNALLATEDIRYFQHSGVDLRALVRVLFKTVLGGEESSGGGSTISQQLAKLLFKRESLSGKSSIQRAQTLLGIKFKEWITAVRLEKRYTKEEVMAMYLNKFEFINGAHGIQAAAQIYFGKDQSDLLVEEAATLVGMLKNPSRYNPVRFTNTAESRRNVVLRLMARNDKISKRQRDTLIGKPLDTSEFDRKTHVDGPAPYFRSELTKWLKDLFDQNENFKPDGTKYDIYRDGLNIYTTIDLNYQSHAEKALVEHMANNQKRYWRVWGRKDPITYELNRNEPADSLKIAIRRETIERRIRTLDQYEELYEKYFNLLSEQTSKSFGVELKEPTIRRLLRKRSYVNQIDDDVRDKFRRLVASNYWIEVRRKWKEFKDELDERLEEKTDRKVFAYNEEGFEVKNISLLDSLLHQTRIMQSGLLSIDPRTGKIKAWVGGVNFENFKYDHVNFRRQVGSTIKPFVYATAIGVQGISPCHEYDDIQYTITPGDANFQVAEEWTPSNANGLFTGNKYNLYQGLLYSKNSITVRMVKELGTVEPVRDLLHNVGISKSERYYNGRLLIPSVPSICLGSVDLSLMEITGGYTTFANNGVFSKPHFVDRIEDKNGKIIYQSAIQQNLAINPFYNAVILDMLRNNTGGGRGMGLKSDLGGKTGTTNDYADGWFLGVTPTLVTGVWVGGDEKWVKFYTLDDGQGFVMARPIFMNYMKLLEADENASYDPEIKFPKNPSGFREFIDCDRYKQGEPEDELERTKNEDEQFDVFVEDELLGDIFDDFEEVEQDTVGME